MQYVVDTNIFNKIADGLFSIAELESDVELIATPIQRQQINNTSNPQRREKLNAVFNQTAPTIALLESSLWGSFNWGESKWSDGKRALEIKSLLDEEKASRDNVNDARIGEVALANGYGLLTADQAFGNVMRKLKVPVIVIVPRHLKEPL